MQDAIYWGELTDLGRRSTLSLGTALRALYVPLGFLPPTLWSDRAEQVSFRSTNMPRTIESLHHRPALRIDSAPRASGVLDTIFVCKAHGIKVPPELEDLKTLRTLEVAIVHECAKRRAEKTRLHVYLCHDTSVAGILNALEAFDKRWPPFTSHLAVELLRAAAAPSALSRLLPGAVAPAPPAQHYVRLRYNARPLVLPACAPAGKHLPGPAGEVCTWEALRDAVRAVERSRPPPYEPAEPAKAPTRRWWHLDRAERDLIALSLLLKLLLFPAYRSTDFEVHRNWLAVTHSLPLSKWYYDTTSEWTLDYPPFFAFFERVLSAFAYVVDPEIVRLDNLGYATGSAVAFQRTTVILSELVLALGLFRWARTSQQPDYPTARIIAASVLFHPGLLIVDHIHFQYNGFLLGMLLWSLIAARDNNLYTCAALFATLLNFKHIFIYLALPYFVFLLRRHCYPPGGKFQIDRVVELGLVVVSICTLSFGPFLLTGGPSQIKQIVSRLFPFQRGLNHAYWAGNMWALVSAVDRVLVKYLVARGWPISQEALTSSSRGLIGATTFGVLPNVTPRHTFAITFGFTAVFLVKLWFDPSFKRFLDSVVLAAMTSFLFGWHVHEKAVLLFLIPLSLTATDDDNHFRSFLISTTAGVYGLFPLLIKPAETPIKVIFTVLWAVFVFPQLRRVVYRPLPGLLSMLVDKAEALYLIGFFALQLYTSLLHSLLFPSAPVPAAASGVITCAASAVANGTCTGASPAGASEASMEFLPLMLTSVYCAVGIVWSWVRLSWGFLTS
ncbi:hypothetical protein JCM3770_002056 [Rhodotorula araucariae]